MDVENDPTVSASAATSSISVNVESQICFFCCGGCDSGRWTDPICYLEEGTRMLAAVHVLPASIVYGQVAGCYTG